MKRKRRIYPLCGRLYGDDLKNVFSEVQEAREKNGAGRGALGRMGINALSKRSPRTLWMVLNSGVGCFVSLYSFGGHHPAPK